MTILEQALSVPITKTIENKTTLSSNNNIINQSLKTSLVNYIGIALGAFFTLYISPKYLTIEYNGLYRLLVEYAAVAGAYFHFGMPTIINKYFHRIFDNSGRSTKGFDFIVVLVPIIAITILSLLLTIFRGSVTSFLTNDNDLDLVFRYILYIIPLIITSAYSILIEAYTAMLGNIVKVNFYRNVLVKIFNIASILVYALTLNFTYTMLLIACGSMLSVVLSFMNLGKLKEWNFDFRPSLEFLQVRGLKRDFFKYALYLIGGNLTLFLVTKIDIFFVGKLGNLSEVAYYTTAMFFIAFINVPYMAILNISFPQISKAFIDNDTRLIKNTLTNNALFAFSISLFIALMIWINIDAVYQIMPNGELYSAGKYVFLILAIGKLADNSIGSLGQLLTISKWYMYTLYFSILISVISITLGYSLTMEMGIYGTALAVAICNWASVIYQLSMVGWKFKITPYNRNFAYVLLLIPPILLLSFGIDAIIDNIWLNLSVKSFLATTIFFGGVYKLNLSPEIKQIIASLVNKIKR